MFQTSGGMWELSIGTAWQARHSETTLGNSCRADHPPGVLQSDESAGPQHLAVTVEAFCLTVILLLEALALPAGICQPEAVEEAIDWHGMHGQLTCL